MNVVNCEVVALESLTCNVYKVLLKPQEQVTFLPGQYLNLMMSPEDKRPFSIASSPDKDLIELQIGAFGAESYAMQVIEYLQKQQACNGQISIEVAAGNAYLREESERPLLLIAGGTGFSYIKSIIDHLAAQKSQREVIVYWGLREPSACFEMNKTQETITQLAHGVFYPVVEIADENWAHKTGIVHRVVMQDILNLCEYDIYLAGRFDMIGTVRSDFVTKGADVKHMYADAFAFI